jgi:hypothetical protein
VHGLNTILGTQSKVFVLRVLLRAGKPLTGRAVERLSGLSNRATMLALDALVEARAVTRRESGRAYLFALNRNNYLVMKAIRPAFNAEEFFWDDVRKTVRRLVRPRPRAAVATGPLARDETEYGGRLILTMVFQSARSRMGALSTMDRLSSTTRERYAMTLEHHLLDINTMDRAEYVPLWRRVEREGILLFGTLP